MVPEGERDEALKTEMTRLFEETKQDMQIFDKVMILVHKNWFSSYPWTLLTKF